jgi:hypothetical protein
MRARLIYQSLKFPRGPDRLGVVSLAIAVVGKSSVARRRAPNGPVAALLTPGAQRGGQLTSRSRRDLHFP